jgi:hypothetical protein
MKLQRAQLPVFLMNPDTLQAIAARIRALISCEDPGPAEASLRLGVTEDALRAAIDYIDPNPSVEVLAAVVVLYGVDPTWLLSGGYDAGTHRSAMQSQSILDHDKLTRFIARHLDDDADQSRLEA